MRILLIVTCCFALASSVGAVQLEDGQNNPNPKKKDKGQALVQPQQGVNPKAYKPRAYANPKLQQGNPKWQANPNLKGNPNAPTGYRNLPAIQSNKTTTFNKTKTFNNTTINKTTVNNTTFKNTTFKGRQFNLVNKPHGNIPQVTFNANIHIAGSQNWQGQRYAVFRDYRPAWHDRAWWVGHHNRVVFVFGGWYYWDTGYWRPAWGYDPASVYYYDGPIYASTPEVDPGQVVANVQSALQEQGYYQGEVDGVLGPQTRGALADYQQAQGLEPTGAVDEPTLESLGLA
jgi:Putative peptidoglycan binding domain